MRHTLPQKKKRGIAISTDNSNPCSCSYDDKICTWLLKTINDGGIRRPPSFHHCNYWVIIHLLAKRIDVVAKKEVASTDVFAELLQERVKIHIPAREG